MPPIPTFPAFRPLSIGDRGAIEALTRGRLPYSDFGFTSLWCWAREESCAIALRRETLVVQLRDYVTDAPFLTFLGDDDPLGAVRDLQAFARAHGFPETLRLVPETAILADERLPRLYAVAPDPDNDDYLYAARDWADFAGAGFREHRRLLARCRERFPLAVHDLDLADVDCQQAIIALFDRWAAQKSDLTGMDRCHERSALQRTFALGRRPQLAAIGFHDGSNLVGFTIWETLTGSEHGVCHFQKSDRRYPGLSSWQAQEIGRRMLERGCAWINFEQDLGIPGLRCAKRSLRPQRLLRKFTIDPRRESVP